MICEDCKHTIPGDEAAWCGECVENALSAARAAEVREFAEWLGEFHIAGGYESYPDAAARFLARKEPTDLGHAAGEAEGARRFAEAIQKDYSGCVYKKTWRLANACHRVLSSLAPGTELATGEGQKEKEKP